MSTNAYVIKETPVILPLEQEVQQNLKVASDNSLFSLQSSEILLLFPIEIVKNI